jgi:hypothetical protein
VSSGEGEHNRWRLLAIEALAIAKTMTHPHSKAMMVNIAAGYERLAEQAQKHAEVLAALRDQPPEPEKQQ